MYLSFCSWLISGYIIQCSTSSQNPTLHIYLLVVTSGRVMALVISESDQILKKTCIHNVFNIFQKTSVHWFPSEFGIGDGRWQPQPHCKSQTRFSANSPNVTKLRLFRPWHRRLSAFLTFVTFLFSLWFLGRLAQLLHSQCHHALSKRQTKFWIVQLQHLSYKSYSSDFGGFVNSSKHTGISLDRFVHLRSSSFCVWIGPSVKDREDQKQRLPRSPIGHLVHLFLHWIHIWCRLKSGYANYASAYLRNASYPSKLAHIGPYDSNCPPCPPPFSGVHVLPHVSCVMRLPCLSQLGTQRFLDLPKLLALLLGRSHGQNVLRHVVLVFLVARNALLGRSMTCLHVHPYVVMLKVEPQI